MATSEQLVDIGYKPKVIGCALGALAVGQIRRGINFASALLSLPYFENDSCDHLPISGISFGQIPAVLSY
jgi:hypothetical protein